LQDVFAFFGDHYAERANLVHAGVGGIESAGQRIEADLSYSGLLQFCAKGICINQRHVGLRDRNALF
jgi:hypothetical protein